MNIVCPHCETSYRVTPESLGETGRAVRCVNCQNVWFEEPRQAAFEADDPSFTSASPSMIRPPLDDVVEIGLTASRRPAWDQRTHDETSAETDFGNPTTDLDLEDRYPAEKLMPDGPSIVPPDGPETGRNNFDGRQDIESLAARRTVKRPASVRLWSLKPTIPGVICVMVVVLGALLIARQQIVRVMPQTASLYAAIGLPVNLRGLAFEDIKTLRETEDGQPMLVVEGNIVGTTGRLTEVPRLRFGVVDAAGKEIYAWTARPSRALLPPGETLNFRSRLASPPADANSITVRFFNRRDAQAGLL